MSTEYTVFEKAADNGYVHSIALYEHSSLFEMWTFASKDGVYLSEHLIFKDFTPAQIIGIALEMLKVASYQIDKNDFKEATRAAINKDKGGVGFVTQVIHEVENENRGG